MTVLAGYAWIHLYLRLHIGISACLMCACTGACTGVFTCHINDFLHAGFSLGIVTT